MNKVLTSPFKIIISLSLIFIILTPALKYYLSLEVNNLVDVNFALDLMLNLENFIKFGPFSAIIVTAMFLSIIDKSEILLAIFSKISPDLKPFILYFCIACGAIIANIATSFAIILLVPIVINLFKSRGINPTSAIICVYASGFTALSANVMLTNLDVSLVAITNLLIDNELNPMSHIYFMAFSVLILALVSSLISLKHQGKFSSPITKTNQIIQYKKLTISLLILSISLGFIIYLYQLLDISLNLNSCVFALIFIFVPSCIYFGYQNHTINLINDIIETFISGINRISSFILFIFFAYIFYQILDSSMILELVIDYLKNLELQTRLNHYQLLLVFIICISILNFFIASASIKWTMIAPLVISISSSYNIDINTSLLMYKIIDSSTNVIYPLGAYLPYLLAQINEFQKFTLRNFMQMMWIYSGMFLMVWLSIFYLWHVVFKIPLGLT